MRWQESTKYLVSSVLVSKYHGTWDWAMTKATCSCHGVWFVFSLGVMVTWDFSLKKWHFSLVMMHQVSCFSYSPGLLLFWGSFAFLSGRSPVVGLLTSTSCWQSLNAAIRHRHTEGHGCNHFISAWLHLRSMPDTKSWAVRVNAGVPRGISNRSKSYLPEVSKAVFEDFKHEMPRILSFLLVLNNTSTGQTKRKENNKDDSLVKALQQPKFKSPY